ncbi:MAG: PorT family protein [Bacteroidetes bacterium]|nr:PorT family protein [Bacteroidota bacterium]
MNMLRRWCVLLILLAIPLLGYGQLRVGPVLGGSMVKWKFSESDDSQYYTGKPSSGYHGGMAVNYRVNARYSLHTEGLYKYRQKNIGYQRDKLTASDRAGLHYLAVPVLYRVSFHSNIKKSHQEWYINAGPAFHYWLGGKGRLETNEQAAFLEEGKMNYSIAFREPDTYGSTEFIQPANRWQMALYAGGGVIFDLGFGNHVWVDARISLGAARSFFADDAKGDFGLQLYHDNLQSSVVTYSLSAGYFRDFDIRSVFYKGKSVNKGGKAGKKRSK